MSHVSCTPSSNWTCGFPASSSPTIFFRRRAPQARQMAHPSYHLIQPTPFIQELIVPVLPGGPPTALVFASEPELQLTQHGPIDLMEDPVAVADPKIGTPPIQDRMQLPNHLPDRRATAERSHYFAHPVPDMLARLLARPHVQQPSRGFPKLETKKRETVCHRAQPTLLLVHHQS